MDTKNTMLSTIGLLSFGVLLYVVFLGFILYCQAITAHGIKGELITCVQFKFKSCTAADDAGIDYDKYRQDEEYSKAINKVLHERILKAEKLSHILREMPEAMLSPGQSMLYEAIKLVNRSEDA